MESFATHWVAVNSAISPAVFTLQGGFTLANFTTAKNAIQTALTAIPAADNTRQVTGTTRDQGKAGLRVRVTQFIGACASQIPDSHYGKAAPKVPQFGSNQALFMKAIDDMANLWTQINAATIPGFTGPLLLAGGYTLANFNTDITAMYAAFTAATDAELNATLARRHRDSLLGPARTRMIQYRRGVVSVLPAGHELLSSIPAITPAPGSTPAAVNASGLWSVPDTIGILNWTASIDPHFDHYEVRTSPGPRYNTAEESHVASRLVGGVQDLRRPDHRQREGQQRRPHHPSGIA